MEPQVIVEIESFIRQKEFFWYFQFAVAFFGLCIGSFINVLIWRLPRGEGVVIVPSHCPKCNHPLAWYDNIPVLSYLSLLGKCRYCREPISFRYPAIELLTGALIWWMWAQWTIFEQGNLFWVLVKITTVGVMIPTFFIDWKHRLIPNALTYSFILLGLLWGSLFSENWTIIAFDTQSYPPWYQGLMRSFSSFFIILVLLTLFRWIGNFISKEEVLGRGDIKLLAGFAAAWGVLWCGGLILFGSIFGCLAGIAMVIVYKHRHPGAPVKLELPFGSFLAVIAIIMCFFNVYFWEQMDQLRTSVDHSIEWFAKESLRPNSPQRTTE